MTKKVGNITGGTLLKLIGKQGKFKKRSFVMGPPDPYFCIQCGHPAPQVYKTYAYGNLVKLLNCKSCGELIDKYVEYDVILVAINLILLNPVAYRHVLLNHAFHGFWKLGVVSLFIEAYCYWCFKKGISSSARVTDFYELEINFYKVLLRTFISTFVFQFLVILFSWFVTRRQFHRHSHSPLQYSYTAVWKGVCLAGFTEIFKLVALIWSYANDHTRLYMVNALFILSNMQCFHVTTGLLQISSLLIVGTCFAITKYFLQFYDQFVTI